MCLFGQPERPQDGSSPPESLFEYVARNNGPLVDYHPQMLLQCLLWGQYSNSRRPNLSLNSVHRKNRAR